MPDFRSPGGIWSRYRPVTIQEFKISEEARRRYWLYKKETYADFAHARPNATHNVLARLEAEGRLLGVITQNIDGLHQDAGSRNVVELHGTNRRYECLGCARTGPAAEAQERLLAGEEVPACRDCGAPLKAATISFGQALKPEVLDEARLARAADLMIVLGSSLVVYPAAIRGGGRGGAPMIIINREPTPLDRLATVALQGEVEAAAARPGRAVLTDPRRAGAFALAGLLLAGAALRVFPFVLDRSLWLDEAKLALNILDRSPAGMFRPLDHDQAAPVGFLLLEKQAATLLGEGERALRLVPLLGGLASLVLVYAVARHWLPKPESLLALCLFALSTPLVYYATEVKQYSTDVFTALALLWAAGRVLAGKPAALASLLVAGAVGVWLSHPAVFVVAGIGSTLLVSAWRQGERQGTARLAAVAAAWAASFLAHYVLVLAHSDPKGYLVRFWADGFPALVPRSLADLTWWIETPFGFFTDPAGLRFAGLAAACFALGAWRFWRSDRRVLGLLVSPFLFTLLAAVLHRYPSPPGTSPDMYPIAGRPVPLSRPRGLDPSGRGHRLGDPWPRRRPGRDRRRDGDGPARRCRRGRRAAAGLRDPPARGPSAGGIAGRGQPGGRPRPDQHEGDARLHLLRSPPGRRRAGRAQPRRHRAAGHEPLGRLRSARSSAAGRRTRLGALYPSPDLAQPAGRGLRAPRAGPPRPKAPGSPHAGGLAPPLSPRSTAGRRRPHRPAGAGSVAIEMMECYRFI